MSLIKDLQNKFHDIVHNLHDSALGFFDALATAIENSGGQVLRDAALAAVQAAETAGGSGDDKFKAAVASVIAVLEKEGIPVAVNAVQGAVLGAVAKVKA
jgi:hypothetical protein